MDKVIDIWCQCFFGYVGKDNRRMCAFDDKSFHCTEDCPYRLTKKEANDICKEVIKNGNDAADQRHMR